MLVLSCEGSGGGGGKSIGCEGGCGIGFDAADAALALFAAICSRNNSIGDFVDEGGGGGGATRPNMKNNW